MELIVIDVSELVPPEPMVEILKALSKLEPSQCLKVIHSREPFPLYKKLSESNWCYFVQSLSEKRADFKRFNIFVYKRAQSDYFESLFTSVPL
ncbi:DUF2249 domain-containing protein [Pseudoalteromonas denitrificans]|uniref:Uncharacterized conserved protein n=1 Tax=Pseudoalteromonas denitrificans DSM 6059 TaxID=1123010 RepID=A0A1I1RE91_9GAMM|nr:DUF2249 domain-containing protein [Pseudoalteromonas denitrificans]SFD28710.1 Uncharacterized conserved protein [Pseudoalteromonas denitrificans DSM 6059]